MKKVTFENPETGKQLTGTFVSEKLIGEQKWQLVTVGGVRWAVPAGWPNNALPICEESDPEEYAKIAA